MTINGSLLNIPIVKRFFGTVPALNHVTCKRGGQNNHIFGIPTPLCVFTMQLLLGYDDDKWQFTEHPHCEAVFVTVPALDHVTLRGQNSHIFGIHDPTLPIHYSTFRGLRWRLRVVYSWASPLLSRLNRHFKPNLQEKFKSSYLQNYASD